MSIQLIGGASTQSRARRPLPPGAVSAMTIETIDVREAVEFRMADGSFRQRVLLSWVIGQSGVLWGSRFPFANERHNELSGAYGHSHEYRLTEILGEVFAGKLTSDDLGVRFFQNASDACAAAARVCRAHTDRNGLASTGYHGTHLDFAHEPASQGVPPSVLSLHKHFDDWREFKPHRLATPPAAVVLEVLPGDDDEIREWLTVWRNYCDQNNVPLVLDDTVLGFRIALGGSAEYYGIRPDLIILGKAMSGAGGMAALIGRRDIVGRLADDVFYSTTFGGSPGACELSARTVQILIDTEKTAYQHLFGIGTALKDGLNGVFGDRGIPAQVIGQPVRSVVVFDEGEAARREWCGKMIEQGIIVDRPFFPTLAHTLDHVRQTLEAARAVSV